MLRFRVARGNVPPWSEADTLRFAYGEKPQHALASQRERGNIERPYAHEELLRRKPGLQLQTLECFERRSKFTTPLP